MSGEGQPGLARAAAGLLVIAAILVAFLYQLTTSGEVALWLMLLVSVLGLAAGAAVLGVDALRAGYAVLCGLRRGKR